GPRRPHPEYDSRLLVRLPEFSSDVARRLLDHVEARVLEKAGVEPLGLPKLAIPCAALDRAKQDFLEKRGDRVVRRFFRMACSLEGALVPPTWPKDMEVATVDAANDDRALHRVLQDSFADHYRFMPEPFEQWMLRNFGHPDFAPGLSFLVRHRGEPVAASANF